MKYCGIDAAKNATRLRNEKKAEVASCKTYAVWEKLVVKNYIKQNWRYLPQNPLFCSILF